VKVARWVLRRAALGNKCRLSDKDVFQGGLVNDRKLHRITKFLLRSAPDNVKISASELPRNSMLIHHVNGIDWLVITAFEELKTMFIEEAGIYPLASLPPAN
jgi:hypothetical protein